MLREACFHCVPVCRVTLIEAQQLLGTFDAPLREYAANRLNKQGVHLLKVCQLRLCSCWLVGHALDQQYKKFPVHAFFL